MIYALLNGARGARAFASASLLLLAAVAAAPRIHAQEPEVPPGWVLVDDVILPYDVVYGDSTYNAVSWTNGIVPYAFNANVTAANQTIAIDAMAEWAAVANLTFIPRTTQSNYINFNNSSSNSSFVGMIGGSQTINVFNWSFRFIVCHEICHALGFLHEQQRPDRNTYVTINFANIDPPYVSNFNISTGATTYGVYDFDSLMHYGATAFSINGSPTITINAGYSGTIGQRQNMSILDGTGMATKYGAPAAPTVTSLTPTTVSSGSGQFTLTVDGTLCHKGSNNGLGVLGTVVEWNGVALSSAYVSPTRMTATVPASYVVNGTHMVTIYNAAPGGGVSAGFPFVIGVPAPTLTSASPTSASAGAAGFTLSVVGTVFQPTSVVRFSGTDLLTTYVSPTSMTAVVPAALIAAGGTRTITVHTPAPGGGTSGGVNFNVTSPVPTLTSISPANAAAGSPGVSVTVNGTQLNPATVVRRAGVAVPTTFVSSTQVIGAIPAANLVTPGTATITLFNPTPGGGVSSGATFTTLNTVPTTTSLSPTSAPQGGASFALTINGTNFNTTSVARWNGANMTTAFVSGQQLTATVSAGNLAAAGSATVTVNNPGGGGGTSGGQTFIISAPAPVLASITPTSIGAGGASFLLTANGSNFQGLSKIRWNGVDLPATTFVSVSQLTATVPGANFPNPGFASVSVFNPSGGWTSGSLQLTIAAGVPTLTSIAPNSAPRGSGTITVAAFGSGFDAATVLRWNGAALATTVVSPTFLSASIPAANFTTATTASVTAYTPPPGGGVSAAFNFEVHNPAPTLTSISPTAIVAGSLGATLTVTGTNFISGASTVFWNGTPLATTYQTATSMTAAVPAAALTVGAVVSVQVSNMGPGGGVSASLVCTVLNPTPLVTSISPNSATAGDAPVTLVVSGTAFIPSTFVRWNGAPLSTTFVSANSLQATIPSSLLVPGSVAVSAFSPAPGGGVSFSHTFTVHAPQIASLVPASIPVQAAGAPSFALTVSGTRFLPSSVVWANGAPLPTTYFGTTLLSATLYPAAIVQTQGPGGVSITVRNGGATLSNTMALVVGVNGNAGTQITDPPSATPPYGGTFSLIMEGGRPSQLFSLLADLAATPTVTGFPDPTANFVLEIGSPFLIPVIDGLGLFGPPLFTTYGPNLGGTAPGGTFTILGIPAPLAPSGIELALQVIYVDPTSPVGWRLSHAASPRPY